MKLLILTQKVDVKDGALGFFHGWLKQFSENFEEIKVITLYKGEYKLPENVEIFSLGKETLTAKSYKLKALRNLVYTWKFYKHVFKFRKHYNAVFVHMNQEYVILGGLFWRIWGKKIVFWYNHTDGGIKTRIAMFLSSVVCHTSPYAFTANTKKSQKMPAGINTDIFKINNLIPRNKTGIMYIGRIAPAKKVHLLIEAIKKLKSDGLDLILNIYGSTLKTDEKYLKDLKNKSGDLLDQNIFFNGAIPNIDAPNVFSLHLVSVNLTAKGNYDKTVLEAMACGSLPIVSSEAFSDIVPSELYFKEDNIESLSETIKSVIYMDEEKKNELRKSLRRSVEEKHSLKKLTEKFYNIIK